MRTGVIATLDIGSSKVVCFIAEGDASGDVKILGIGHQVSRGVRGGIVIDMKQAEGSIVEAVHAAEKMAGVTIDRVMVNMAGSHLTSHHLQVETNISGHEVTDRDIQHVINEGYKHFAKDDREILHCIPVHYSIDDTTGIENPRGMLGERLRTHLHIVTASATAAHNLANCLGRCHLNIEDTIATPYAAGLACLTRDEKNLGSILLDIGGGNTAIAVFTSGQLVYIDSIPLGGIHVTRDIAHGLSTSLSYAERIKTLYGSTVSTTSDEWDMIDVPQTEGFEDETTDAELVQISRAKLTGIIKPRMEEIIEMARKKLEKSSVAELLGSRVILTGGASQLVGVRELASHIFDRQVRIAKPEPMEGLAESTKGPAFSVAVGMLRYAMEQGPEMLDLPEETSTPATKNYLGRVGRWLQRNF